MALGGPEIIPNAIGADISKWLFELGIASDLTQDVRL